MIRNIKAVERTAFPQQVKTVKTSYTAGTLCAIGAKMYWKIMLSGFAASWNKE
jgi:hypothetical protein